MASTPEDSFVALCDRLLELGATQVTCGQFAATFTVRPRVVAMDDGPQPAPRPAPRVAEMTHAQRVAAAERALEDALQEELP